MHSNQSSVHPVSSARAPALGDMLPKDEKTHDDMRDRAAYLLLTGANPTHLRKNYMSLLRRITNYAPPNARAIGPLQVNPTAVSALRLDEHPMVVGVRKYLQSGYVLQKSPSANARRPYSKIFLVKTVGTSAVRITVQVDGSVKEGWA